MSTFNGRICTQYKKLPLCNPDFIYLDGPLLNLMLKKILMVLAPDIKI